MPEEPRWPYYLGASAQEQRRHAESIAAFTRALELAPDECRRWSGSGGCISIRAGRTRPSRSSSAPGSWRRATSPCSPASAGGAGRRDYARAVRRSRRRWRSIPARPASTRRWPSPIAAWATRPRPRRTSSSGGTPRCSCPIRSAQELDLALESGLSYELRGVRALERGTSRRPRSSSARASSSRPATTALGRSLRHKLGTALVL